MSSDLNPGEMLRPEPEPVKPAPAGNNVTYHVGTRAGQVVLKFDQPVPGLLFDAQEARVLAEQLCKFANVIDPQRKRHKGKG
jgi:hypothetical protein